MGYAAVYRVYLASTKQRSNSVYHSTTLRVVDGRRWTGKGEEEMAEKQSGWGVVRYRHFARGMGKGEAFDCWYADRSDALAVFEAWSELYLDFGVALVQGDVVRYAKTDAS